MRRPRPPKAKTRAARSERRWGLISTALLALLVFLATFAGVHQATMPQARLETVDPQNPAHRRGIH